MTIVKLLLAGAVALLPAIASADIVSLSGAVVQAGPDAREESAQVSWQEARVTQRDRELILEFGPSWVRPTTVIPMGTSVFLYHFNFSPASAVGGVNGAVTFDTEILGLDFETSLYELEPFDSATLVNIADRVTVSEDRRTVFFSMNVNGAADAFTLWTRTVDEPASNGLLVLALAAAALFRRTPSRTR